MKKNKQLLLLGLLGGSVVGVGASWAIYNSVTHNILWIILTFVSIIIFSLIMVYTMNDKLEQETKNEERDKAVDEMLNDYRKCKKDAH